MRVCLAACLALLLAACSASPPPPTGGAPASTPAGPEPTTAAPSDTTGRAAPPATGGGSAAETACSQDGDCVFVRTTCCDPCNGGSQVSVNRASADAVTARTRGKLDCAHQACTQRACLNPPTPVCKGGMCSSS